MCLVGGGKGEVAGQEKDCCTLGGGVPRVLLFPRSFLPFRLSAERARKLASGLFTLRPIGKARRLGPHSACAGRICCQDLGNRVAKSSTLCFAQPFARFFPSIPPPIREVSRRSKHAVSLQHSSALQVAQTGASLLLHQDTSDTASLTWTS